jgi:hypothetical protein
MRCFVTPFQQLHEQTMFLMKIEKDAFLDCSREMANLLTQLKAKIDSHVDEESKEVLISIEENLRSQMTAMVTSMQEDIEFLHQQVKAMNQITEVTDPVRRAELERIMLQEAGELIPMEEFKKDIEAHSQEAKTGFFAMTEDIRNAIEEGNEEELSMLLQAMAEEEDDNEDDDGCCGRRGCDEDEDDEAETKSCGTRKSDSGCCDDDEECCDDDEGCCDDDDEDKEGETLSDDLLYDIARAFGKESEGCCKSEAAPKKECCKGEFDCGDKCVCDNDCGCDA